MQNIPLPPPPPPFPPKFITNDKAIPLFLGSIGLEKGNHKFSTVYEIKLGDACLLDSLHIVPLGIVPPLNSNVKIIGKTRPDISTRPFKLKMFIRNIETNHIVPVQEWTIQGGVQHLPLPVHIQSMYSDYVAFAGDFDMITVIINGNKGSQPKEKLFKFLNAKVELDASNFECSKFQSKTFNVDADYNSDDEDLYEYEEDIMSIQLKHLRHLTTISSLSLQKRLRKLNLRSSNLMISSYFDQCRYPLYDTSKVSLLQIGNLIEIIFSLNDEDYTTSNILDKINEMTHLGNCIEGCWKVRFKQQLIFT